MSGAPAIATDLREAGIQPGDDLEFRRSDVESEVDPENAIEADELWMLDYPEQIPPRLVENKNQEERGRHDEQ